jgi:transcriptional regulator with XRE-family HTH domain
MSYDSIRAARRAMHLTLSDVATLVETTPGNLSRIERGLTVPSKDVARRLFDVFEGAVELGAIYDPTHSAGLPGEVHAD